MASCTAITYVNGILVGDPLDVKMFEATGWTLDESQQSRTDADGQNQLIIAQVYPSVSKNQQPALESTSSTSVDDEPASVDDITAQTKSYKNSLTRRFDFTSML